MNETILVVKGAFDVAWCNACFNAVKKTETASVGQGTKSNSIRRSNISFLNGTVRHANLFVPLIKFIGDINENHYKWDLTDPECIQFTEYNESNQGMYRPHKDTNNHSVDQQIVRKLSLSIQLTDGAGYEGGDLIFPDQDEPLPQEELKTIGTAIVFPSYLNHGVTPVTKGTRHSAVSWVLGPPFK